MNEDFCTLAIKFQKVGIIDKPLWFEIWVDDQKYYGEEVVDTDLKELSIQLSDSEEKERVLKFVMAGKTYDYTHVDDKGEVIADCSMDIKEITLEDLDIKYVLTTKAEYRHAFNKPNAKPEDYNIYKEPLGCMGCNGEVTTKFATPAFIWLLENL